jgi:hypothetical protein
MLHHCQTISLDDIYLEDIPHIIHPGTAAHNLADTAQPNRFIQEWDLPQNYSQFVSRCQTFHWQRPWAAYRDTLNDIKFGKLVLLRKNMTGYNMSGVLTTSGDLRNDLPSLLQARLRYILSRQQRRPAYYARPTAESKIKQEEQPEQRAQAAKKKEKIEITIILGIFFDGTGNNAVNTENMLNACTAKHYNLANSEAEGIISKCAKDEFGFSGVGATSYTGYYTNVYWLNKLYLNQLILDNREAQYSIYIDGIGTGAGKSDSSIGQGLGISDTGVVAKTDKAVSLIPQKLRHAVTVVKDELSAYDVVIKKIQFDIFGFSRGAAATRHFANRVQSEDAAIISAIRAGMAGTTFEGSPAGKNRFIGIFDTVAAIGTPTNGLNPHNADTGDVNIILRPGVAEKVFHITAANECRFNFALNSIKPAWPELALPGVHSDIGGGYYPVVEENLFLTRPETTTVPLNYPDEQTRSYHKAMDQLPIMDSYPSIAPILRTSEISVETWYDDRMPSNHYGELQKRSFAALTLRNRVVKNDWSKITLRVMVDAAKEAGVAFEKQTNSDIPDDLITLCDKAIAMGKTVRSGGHPEAFNNKEFDIIAKNYIHTSANWNSVMIDSKGSILGGASPSETIGFVNRPDERWRRTVYNMDGKKSQV